MKRRVGYTSVFIIPCIEKNLVDCTDLRKFEKCLERNLKDKWRYRVGNYRILAKIEDDQIIVVILEVGHRSTIYREQWKTSELPNACYPFFRFAA